MLNDDILSNLLKSIEETNKKTIQEANNNQTREIQNYINSEIHDLKQKIEEDLRANVTKWENEYQDLKSKYAKLEKETRKNNLIIFGVHCISDNLPVYITELLSKLLKISISVSDINNVYTIGKQSDKKPIILKLVSYLKKQEILHNAKNLKGTNISISEELTLEERQENKILRRHLHQARDKKLNAYIKNKKLVVNGEEYTANELTESEENTTGQKFNIEENLENCGLNQIVQPTTSAHSKKPKEKNHTETEHLEEEDNEEVFVTEEVGETRKRKIIQATVPLQRLKSSSKLGNSENYLKKVNTRSTQNSQKL